MEILLVRTVLKPCSGVLNMTKLKPFNTLEEYIKVNELE